MPEEIVKLKAEMDVSGVTKGAKEAEKAVKDSTAEMDKAVKKTAAQTLKIGESASKVAGLATAGFSAIGAGITAANANADNLASSMVSVSSSLAAAFIAGGPIGLGVGLLGVGIGLIAGNTDEAADAAARAEAAHTSWLTKTKGQADSAAEAIARMRAEIEAQAATLAGDPVTTAQILLERQIDKAAAELKALRSAAVGLITRGPRAIDAPLRADEAAAFDKVTAQEKKLALLRAQLQQVESGRRTDNKAARDEAFRDLQREIDGVNARTEAEKFALEQAELRRTLEEDPLGPRESQIEEFLAARQRRFDEAAASEREKKAREQIAGVVKRIAQSFGEISNEIDRQDQATAGATDALDRQIDILQTRTLMERDLALLAQQVRDLRKTKVAEDRIELFIAERLLQIEKSAADRKAQEDTKAQALRDAEEKRTKAVKEAREKLNDAVRLEIRLLGAANDAERERILILDDIAQKRKAGADSALLAALQAARLGALDTDGADDSIRSFVESLAPTLSGGISDLIADGIENGFENGTDIARAIWSQLLRSIINSLVTSGLDSIIGSLFGGGGGGGGLGGILGLFGGGGGGGGLGAGADVASAGSC